MVKPHTSMKIYKVKSTDDKGRQQWEMVNDCISHWYRLNNSYTRYSDIMNMKTYRWNDEHHCPVALTYHIKPNKW